MMNVPNPDIDSELTRLFEQPFLFGLTDFVCSRLAPVPFLLDHHFGHFMVMELRAEAGVQPGYPFEAPTSGWQVACR
jgi:hypothetical protein